MNEIDFTRLDKKVAELCDEDAAEVCAQYAARQKLETEAIFFSDMRGGARTLMEHCLFHEVVRALALNLPQRHSLSSASAKFGADTATPKVSL